MNEPRDYTPRQPTVTALQFDGENDAAVALFAGVVRNRESYCVRVVPRNGKQGRLTLYDGDWLIKSGDTFSVMSAADFAATYEAVE